MARRRGMILILLGLVLALFTGFLVFNLLRQAVPVPEANQPLPPTQVPTRPVPVAARLLGEGSAISETDITIQQYPEGLVPVGILTDTEEIAGQILVEGVEQGEFFRSEQLLGSGEGPLSQQIPAGRVVLAFPVADLLNQSRVIREGDRVDLLLTVDIEEESATETRTGKATNVTLQNVNVFRIVRENPNDQNPDPAPTSILFEMAPQDAVIAKFVKDVGGTIDFTLRSPLDTETFTTEAITQDYLFDNYNLRAPRSGARPKQQ